MASTNIIVDDKANKPELINPSEKTNARTDSLATWIVTHVNNWVRVRDQNYRDKWEEYYRLWRGVWSPADKTRQSERSRIIAPALQQAVEATVSELEEATFGRVRWIDLEDNRGDSDPSDMEQLNKQLLEDFEMDGVKAAISETYLNAAIYGTGIAKIMVGEKEELLLDPRQDPKQAPNLIPVTRVMVSLCAIEPLNFAIDPPARTIDEAMGCAHLMLLPRHLVTKRQAQGIYNNVKIGIAPADTINLRSLYSKGMSGAPDQENEVKVIEYHGLVPKRLLPNTRENQHIREVSLFEEDKAPFDIDGRDMVEAIVTIANDSVILKATLNPFIMKDRSFISYQHDTVPNSFWGRGITEKGYNSQKALDAEIRARIDALGFANNPMIARSVASLSAASREQGHSVYPGKTLVTSGDPRTEVLPITFPGPAGDTYRQAGELERMIQMGTGAMDSATPIGISPRNQTASGMSMILAGAIKRQKRTMANIERNFLDPLVTKALWRYMQLDTTRYPTLDYKFTVHSTMGIMAREFEQQQLSNLLNTVPPDSPAYWLILDSIYENSSLSRREEARQLIQQFLQKTLQPPDPRENPEFQMKMQELQIKEKEATTNEARVRGELFRVMTDVKLRERLQNFSEVEAMAKRVLENAELSVELEKSKAEGAKLHADAILALAKAEAEEMGSQLETYTRIVDNLSKTYEAGLKEISDLKSVVGESSDMVTTLASKAATLTSEFAKLQKEVSEREPRILERITQAAPANDLRGLEAQVAQLRDVVAALDQQKQAQQAQAAQGVAPQEGGRIKIDRDSNGLVSSVNGRPVVRNEQGLITEV